MSFGSIGYRNSTSKTFYSNVKNLRSARTISVFGDPQIITSDYKFGAQSANFDSVGDYITASYSNELFLGTQSFCVEMWVKFNNLSTPANQYLFDFRSITSNILPSAYYDSANSRIAFQTASTIRASKVHTFNTNDWFHIAVTRSGSVFRVFVNGESSSTYSSSGTFSNSSDLLIGRGAGSTITNLLNGKIDEFCITIGDAKYTSNFTPPSEPLLNTDQTVLLLNFENGFADNNL